MTEFIRNAAAVLFAIAALLALIAILSRTEPILLIVGVLIAGIAGVVLALGSS